MKHCKTLLTFVILFVVFVSQSAFGTEIFVWDHDNTLSIDDVTLENRVSAVEGVTQTLQLLEINFSEGEDLPEDLSGYDVIVIPLGFACPT